MECLIGMQFVDFVMVAADQTNARSIMVMKSAQNIALYKMRNGYELSPSAAANFTRRNLADYLRSRTPYMVNPLIAGFDTETGKPELYFMDYLAAMIQTKYACHGYGGFFSTSIMDRHHRTDMTKQQAYALMVECVKEVQKRLVLNLP